MRYPKNRVSRDAPVLDRLLRYIDFASNGCWIWQAALNDNGYGLLRINGRNVRAHRVAYEELVEIIPTGLQLDHLCRNRSCVNPDHLEPVTAATNILRGTGASARNAAKTHCPKNHAYDEKNTCRSGGGRVCRTCARERMAAKRSAAA